jgi:hypothetical protein
MSIYCEVFPSNDSPNKYQMEALFNSIRPESITPEIIAKLGLVKESRDEWRITAALNAARRHFAAFYATLDRIDKLLFQIPYLNSGVFYVQTVLHNVEEVGLDMTDFLGDLSALRSKIIARLRTEIKPVLLS